MEAGNVSDEGNGVLVGFAVLAFACGFVGDSGGWGVGGGFGGEVNGGSTCRWLRVWWGWVDDFAVGVSGDGVAIVVKTAPVGVVHEVVLKELGFG